MRDLPASRELQPAALARRSVTRLEQPGCAGEQLLAGGIDAGEIVDGTPGPRQEMRLADPDGYELMVAQMEATEVG